MDWGSIFSNAMRAVVGVDAAAYALAAIGLNIHFGYTGLLNFGQAGFMAIGAYGIAISVASFSLPLWAGLLIGVGASVVLAILLGIPTLRLRADYLAIVTIAASEIVRLVARSVSLREYTGGSGGLTQFAREFYAINPFKGSSYGIGAVSFSANATWVLTVAWLAVGLASLSVWLTMRSPWGRVLKAIREEEDAARSLGKSVYFYKMQSLIYGGIIGSMGGFVFALATQSVQPDTYSTPVTFFAYLVLILGGTARVFGPVVGSMIFWALMSLTDNLLRQGISSGNIPSSLMSGTQAGQVRFMLLGLGLMALMIFRPQGIFGDKREIDLDA